MAQLKHETMMQIANVLYVDLTDHVKVESLCEIEKKHRKSNYLILVPRFEIFLD